MAAATHKGFVWKKDGKGNYYCCSQDYGKKGSCADYSCCIDESYMGVNIGD